MRIAIAAWEQQLTRHSSLGASTITHYLRDAHQFVGWLEQQGRSTVAEDITAQDAKDYRDSLLAARKAPATVNRALVSLTLLFDAAGRSAHNPFRKIPRVAVVEQPPQALARLEWNAVRRAAERLVPRDHGLALALVCLMRYAGPRVGEVVALQLPDVQVSARRGLLIIRRGKGVKHREVPLILEAREPLETYLAHRRELAERWRDRMARNGQPGPVWAAWPDGHLFLGQRGPLTERGVREIIAKVGEAAKLDHALSPHDLRHTFAKALLDPAVYGLDRAPAPITAVQELMGHADITTTAAYTRATPADLARIMGDSIG